MVEALGILPRIRSLATPLPLLPSQLLPLSLQGIPTQAPREPERQPSFAEVGQFLHTSDYYRTKEVASIVIKEYSRQVRLTDKQTT